MPIGGRRRRGKRRPDNIAEGGPLCPPFAFGGRGDCCFSSMYTHTAKLSMMARTNIRNSSMMLWPPGVGWHVCTLRKAWYGSGRHQQRCHACATEHPDGEDEHGGNGSHQSASAVSAGHGVLAHSDPLRRLPIHNVPIVTLCMKQITFRTMILRCASRTGYAALHNLHV